MKVMNILGINIQTPSYSEMFPIFDHWLSDKSTRSHAVAVINVSICVSAITNKKLRGIYNNADLTGSDGMPFLKLARALFDKNADRFYAPDLMLQISMKAQEKGYTFLLYGGYPDAPDKIEAYLKQRFDGIKIIGKYVPPFRPLTEEEDDALCEMINRVQPDFLWVGLGSPKQDIWIHEHLEKIRGSILIPSGATFDFFSGRIRQAPKWVRDIGFEWLFRLTQDFKRLWRRYTIYNLIFLVAFFLQLIKFISFDTEGYLRILGQRTRLGNS